MKTTFADYAEQNKERFESVEEFQALSASAYRNGERVERLFMNLCSRFGVRMEVSTDLEDIFMGYDFKLIWENNGRHYSIMVDLTTREKKNIDYLSHGGEVVAKEKAVPLGGEKFSALVALKREHDVYFTYHTPVYVLEVDLKWMDLAKYEKEFMFVIGALKWIHEQSDRPQRASKLIYKKK